MNRQMILKDKRKYREMLVNILKITSKTVLISLAAFLSLGVILGISAMIQNCLM